MVQILRVREGYSREESSAVTRIGDSHRTDDATAWFALPRQFADAGACVIVTDHIPKDAQNKMMPISSQAKHSGDKGAIYFLDAPSGEGSTPVGATETLVRLLLTGVSSFRKPAGQRRPRPHQRLCTSSAQPRMPSKAITSPASVRNVPLQCPKH